MKTHNIFKPIVSLLHKAPAAASTQPASSSTGPNTPPPSTEADAHSRTEQGKKSRNRFLNMLGKKPKPKLSNEEIFQAGLKKLRDGASGSPPIQQQPVTTPTLSGSPSGSHALPTITETGEAVIELQEIEQPLALPSAQEVAKSILDLVKEVLADELPPNVLDDIMADNAEEMDTADPVQLMAGLTAEIASRLELAMAERIPAEMSEVIDEEVQNFLDDGFDEIIDEFLANLVDEDEPEAGDIAGASGGAGASEIEEIPDTDEIEETGASGAGDAAATVAKQLGTAPMQSVIDPKTHEIRQESLTLLAADMMLYLDNMAEPLGEDTVDTLRKGLAKVYDLGGKNVPADLTHGELGLAARDCYKDLADNCALLAKDAAPEKRDALLTLRALFDELKRHHLSNAATPIFKEYAAAEVKKMTKDNIGMVQIRAGSAMGNTGEQKIGVTVGPVALEVKRERKRDMKIDDDNDVMNTDYTGGTVSAGGDAKKWLTLKGMLKATLGGRYRKTTNFSNLAKIVAADESNHPSRLRATLLAKSAGKRARQWDKRYQAGWKIGNAHLLHGAATAPGYLTADKVAKGAYNTTAMRAAARRLDRALDVSNNGSGAKRLTEIIKTAYPSISDLSAKPGSTMDYSPLPTLSGGSTHRGKEKKTTITGAEIGFEAKGKLPNFMEAADALKALKPGKGEKAAEMVAGKGLAGIAELNATVKARRVETALERLKPMHTMITTGYTKDMRVSLNVLGTLENAGARNDTVENRRISAKLGLYQDMNRQFLYDPGQREESHNIDFFGPDIDIPTTYLGTVRAPKQEWSDLLETVTQQCADLQRISDRFEEAAGTLHIENRNADPAALKKDFAALQDEATATILRDVWPKGYPGFPSNEAGVADTSGLATSARLRREFIADSHDAISTVLASMGTHLEIIKAKILDEHKANPEALESDPALAGILDKVKQANKGYADLGKAVEAGNIPMSKNELYRYNSLAWAKVNARNEIELQVGAKAGAQFKMISFIREQLTGKVPGVIADLNTSAATMGLTLGFKFIDQDHPNYSRKGEFLEFSVIGGGGNPLVGPLVEKFMREVTKIIYGGPDKFSDTEGPGKFAELSKQALSAGVLDTTQEAQLTWRLHKYSEVPDSKFELQSFKLYQKRKEGVGGALTVPTGVVDLDLGFKVGQESLVPVFEYMGRDIGHHIINYNPLDAVLKAADAAQKKEAEAAGAAAEEDAPAPRNKLEHLSELLKKDSNSYLKSQFFSSNCIFDVVEEYDAFQNKRGSTPIQSSFAFFHTQKIEEAARVARQADATAAGKDLKTTLPTPITEDVIALPDQAALTTAKQALKGMKEGERADYLLNTPEGRDIFNAYTKIVGRYKDINTPATTLHSYAPYLRKEEQGSLQQHVMRPLNTAKNAINATLPFTGGVAGGARKAEQFLEGRNMFTPDKKKDLARILDERAEKGVPDARVTQQSHTWLDMHRIAVADNKMTGAKSLIIAVLQHATGDYGKLYMQESEKYLDRLQEHGAANLAHPTEADLEWVVKAINKDYGKDGGVRLMTPGVEGHPVWTGDVEHGAGDKHAAVLLRDRNENGEQTFTAILHKGDPAFDELKTRRSADQMINRLDNKRMVREHLTKPETNPNGNMLREGTQYVDSKGGVAAKAQKFGKLASATLADYRRPVRKEIREKTDTELREWVLQAGEDENRAADVAEGLKEQERRRQMRSQLTGTPRNFAAPSAGQPVTDAS